MTDAESLPKIAFMIGYVISGLSIAGRVSLWTREAKGEVKKRKEKFLSIRAASHEKIEYFTHCLFYCTNVVVQHRQTCHTLKNVSPLEKIKRNIAALKKYEKKNISVRSWSLGVRMSLEL